MSVVEGEENEDWILGDNHGLGAKGEIQPFKEIRRNTQRNRRTRRT